MCLFVQLEGGTGSRLAYQILLLYLNVQRKYGISNNTPHLPNSLQKLMNRSGQFSHLKCRIISWMCIPELHIFHLFCKNCTCCQFTSGLNSRSWIFKALLLLWPTSLYAYIHPYVTSHHSHYAEWTVCHEPTWGKKALPQLPWGLHDVTLKWLFRENAKPPFLTFQQPLSKVISCHLHLCWSSRATSHTPLNRE